MREPSRDKGRRPKAVEPARPPHRAVGLERFPQRVGSVVLHDRPLTPAERLARKDETDQVNRAKAFRARKRREASA